METESNKKERKSEFPEPRRIPRNWVLGEHCRGDLESSQPRKKKPTVYLLWPFYSAVGEFSKNSLVIGAWKTKRKKKRQLWTPWKIKSYTGHIIIVYYLIPVENNIYTVLIMYQISTALIIKQKRWYGPTGKMGEREMYRGRRENRRESANSKEATR